eukprot:CAMPEP_0175092676 /NCGR_PEP_ID=MMETSP0086_2-20121207/2591_1 /TAXON_ID=136419 /ORGANISM="Unknown Unknown, Strain D1" /LENGTH=346 /DNA_ID=CAMNT_0016365557 /DNA_START=94 /DNA_END=1133 /DNA_ORIENTATION=+
MPEKRGLEETVSTGEDSGDVAASTVETQENVKRVCPEPENGGRPGDWSCPLCGHDNWAFRDACQKCYANKDGTPSDPNRRPGDWNCASCAHMNYAFRQSCQRCHAPKQGGGGAAADPSLPGGSRPGDWMCPNCGDLCYASRNACRKCHTPKPPSAYGASPYGAPPRFDPYGAGGGARPSVPPTARPGDWACPKCYDVNYASRMECRLCHTPKPAVDPAAAYGMYGYGADMAAAQYGADMNAYMGGFAMGYDGAAGAPAPGMPGGRRPGDWDCPQCGDVVYASRNECRKCRTARPGQGGYGLGGKKIIPNNGLGASRRAGDWDCPKCGDVQYAQQDGVQEVQGPQTS